MQNAKHQALTLPNTRATLPRRGVGRSMDAAHRANEYNRKRPRGEHVNDIARMSVRVACAALLFGCPETITVTPSRTDVDCPPGQYESHDGEGCVDAYEPPESGFGGSGSGGSGSGGSGGSGRGGAGQASSYVCCVQGGACPMLYALPVGSTCYCPDRWGNLWSGYVCSY